MEKDEKIKSAMVETYAEDIAQVIENDTGGLVKKIIHGEEEHEAERKSLSPQSKKNRIFILAGLLLIFLAVAILALFAFKKDINTVPVEKQFVPLVFLDKSTFLEVAGFGKDEINQTVLNQINTTSVKVGGVEGIYLTENKQIVGLRRFIALTKATFLPSDNPLFVSDNFLMGAVQTGLKSTAPTAGDFFILMKVRSTTDIFDSLRGWEEKMLSELRGFFGINLESGTNYLLTKNFEDGIVENKNARILYDDSGQLVLMYIYADDNSVIITDSESAAHEILLRLASGQTKQ